MQIKVMTNAHLYGLDESMLVACDPQGDLAPRPRNRLHSQAALAFQHLQSAALKSGIHLHIASGFRSFAQQQQIWERKFNHESRQHLLAEEKVADILRWSALPGTSRHHWGTDFDAYDSSAIERSQLSLEPWEYEPGGPCHRLYLWLEANAAEFGFYRPYDKDRGGVAPEPWHWSYAPLADHYLQAFDTNELCALLAQAKLAGLVQLSVNFDTYIHQYVQQYVLNVAPATF